MMPMARRVLVVMVASMAILPIALVFSPVGPNTPVTIGLSLFAGFFGLATMAFYVGRWPTRTQSLAVTFSATGVIAVAALAQSHPLIGLVGCAGFITPAGYAAFLHTSRYTAYIFAFAVVVAGIQAIRLAAADGVILAATMFWLVVVLNAIVPFGIQTVVHALGVDVLRSERDPLTGLLTRRAFYQRLASALATDGGPGDRYVAITMIDLDRFKKLNDTEGHAAGDRALVAVGRALSQSCDEEALIGRTGGEEFLVATISATADPRVLAEQLRIAIAAAAHPVTASVGVTSMRLWQLRVTGLQQTIDQLVTIADAAMYAAKRAGGNQVRQSRIHSSASE